MISSAKTRNKFGGECELYFFFRAALARPKVSMKRYKISAAIALFAASSLLTVITFASPSPESMKRCFDACQKTLKDCEAKAETPKQSLACQYAYSDCTYLCQGQRQ